MYGILRLLTTYIYYKNHPSVNKYIIYGSSGGNILWGLVYLPAFTIFLPQKSTIHVGKYTNFPRILWERLAKFRPQFPLANLPGAEQNRARHPSFFVFLWTGKIRNVGEMAEQTSVPSLCGWFFWGVWLWPPSSARIAFVKWNFLSLMKPCFLRFLGGVSLFFRKKSA